MSESDGEMATVTVKILDREYQVACPEDEIEALHSSARELDKRMADIRTNGKIIGMDRIAVLAALNATHDLMQLKSAYDDSVTVSGDKVAELTDRVARAITEKNQLKL